MNRICAIYRIEEMLFMPASDATLSIILSILPKLVILSIERDYCPAVTRVPISSPRTARSMLPSVR